MGKNGVFNFSRLKGQMRDIKDLVNFWVTGIFQIFFID